MQSGNLYQTLDRNGDRTGTCILIAVHGQHTLPSETIDKFGLISGRWHYEVLSSGEIKFLSTDDWTLIPVEID